MTNSKELAYAKYNPFLWGNFIMKNKQQIILGSLVLVLAIAILVIVSLISQPQDVRSRAQTTDTTPPTPTSACQTPGGIQNVNIEYPNPKPNDNTGFIFDQANCSWSALTGAANYIITITEVDTGTKVKNNETVSASTTKVIFPVTNGKTYKCDVTGANSCGTTGPIGTATALCKTSVVVSNTPTPTPAVAPTATPASVAPTATPVPTAPPAQVVVPTSTPAPVITSPGNETPIVIGITGVIITIIGGAIFLVAGL